MRLFISYAHLDRPKVSELVEVLREAAYDPWFDHRLMPGQNWKAELLNAIQSCEAFVYALTPASAASEWCQWEFSQAVQMGKPVVPVLLQAGVALPEAISRYQYADFSEGPTPRAVARLMGGLRIMVNSPPPGIVPSAPINPVGRPAQAYENGSESNASNDQLPSAHPQTLADAESDAVNLKVEPSLETDIVEAVPSDPSPTWSVNFSLKRAVTDILPPPFEWCSVPKGSVTLQLPDDSYIVGAFQMACYPVTNAQYRAFADASDGYCQERWWDFSDSARQHRQDNPRPLESAFVGLELPRTQVTWYDALAFCFWLNWKTGLAPKAVPYTAKGIITLPTEQQWQRAAQGENKYTYPWGNALPDDRLANWGGLAKQPLSVTRHPNSASSFGVQGMSGNVWEWCLTTCEGRVVELRTSTARVLRGGAWNSQPAELSVTSRAQAAPHVTSDAIGFRLARAITLGE